MSFNPALQSLLDLSGPVALVRMRLQARGWSKALTYCAAWARRGVGIRRVGCIFLLRGIDPGRKFLVAHHPHRDRHEGVILAAQFRALAVEHAGLGGLEPGLVEAARDRVDLDTEGRHRER